MNVIKTAIPEVMIFEPKVFGDERGFFCESFNQNEFEKTVRQKVNFVQDNHSRSTQFVLRGLHYQRGVHSQGKLVRCTRGAVFDVAVDIRNNSATFGHWVGIELSEENKRQLWIPEGFAHGFLVLSSIADFQYKTTNYYHPESECGIIWNDKDISIKWPIRDDVILSEKDRNNKPLRYLMEHDFIS